MKEKRTCIVCNGEPLPESMLRNHIARSEMVIAADGGIRQLLRIDYAPDIHIGDMDSSEADSIKQSGARETIRHPRDKDHSDSELAVSLALERGAERIILLSAAGLRMDHFLSNLCLLTNYPGMLFIVDETFTAFGLSNRICRCEIECEQDATVSVFSFGDRVQGLSLKGTKWEVDGAELIPGSLGLSNKVTAQVVSISIDSGNLIVFSECDVDAIRIG
jgi:thiamine pyrophosphokinase